MTPSASSPVSSRSRAALRRVAAISPSISCLNHDPKRPRAARHETLGAAFEHSSLRRHFIPGLVPGIHVFLSWMAGTSPAVTRRETRGELWHDPVRAEEALHARAEPAGGAEAAARGHGGARRLRHC